MEDFKMGKKQSANLDKANLKALKTIFRVMENNATTLFKTSYSKRVYNKPNTRITGSRASKRGDKQPKTKLERAE